MLVVAVWTRVVGLGGADNVPCALVRALVVVVVRHVLLAVAVWHGLAGLDGAVGVGARCPWCVYNLYHDGVGVPRLVHVVAGSIARVPWAVACDDPCVRSRQRAHVCAAFGEVRVAYLTDCTCCCRGLAIQNRIW